MRARQSTALLAACLLLGLAGRSAAAQSLAAPVTRVERLPTTAGSAEILADPAAMARAVTIYRDAYGVPHIDGESDEATLFGFAYAQAEDFFWQVEDTYALGLGRYSELYGKAGLNSDLLNRAFEIVPRSQADFAQLEPELQSLYAAFAAGLNHYLAMHPEDKPRLIEHFEPWHVLAVGRHLALEFCFRYTRLSHNYLPRRTDAIWTASGSNAWAIGPERTRDGRAVLLVNPHQPWFGFGQLFEAHLRSGEGWNFIGAGLYGTAMLSFGHNEHLGWAYTTNEPDVADLWRETFDNPNDPLAYRYGDGYRQATEWRETIGVRDGDRVERREHTFRKTHHGPIVARVDDQTFLAARIANLFESMMLRQMMALVRARNLEEFQAGLRLQQFLIMNVIYADQAGNIYFLYNGSVPRRDPRFDWSQPVDGSDPRTEWQGLHALDELPQVLNPSTHYLQNCNSSPFTVSDADSPRREDYARYLAEDADDDKRRAKRSREILTGFRDVTFEQVQQAAFDTEIYWAKHELPGFKKRLEQLRQSDPKLAEKAEPLLAHLLDWDCRIRASSTQATLCTYWYEELYGSGYPGEQLKPMYRENTAAQFRALVRAAAKLSAQHGKWQVPWGEVHRAQRQPWVADLWAVPFSDQEPSLPSLGGHGPMGTVLTQYYTPSIRLPWWLTLKHRYGLLGTSYLAVYEFGPRIRGASLVPFGTSGDPDSPHFFDQAPLLASQQLKPELFYWDDVVAAAKEIYRPGERKRK